MEIFSIFRCPVAVILEGFERWRLPEFLDNPHINMESFLSLRTGRLYPPADIPGTHICYRLSRLQGHRVGGRIMSMKNVNGAVGNRSRIFPDGSAVPQLNAPPLASVSHAARP
jgi:hypothetical protein